MENANTINMKAFFIIIPNKNNTKIVKISIRSIFIDSPAVNATNRKIMILNNIESGLKMAI